MNIKRIKLTDFRTIRQLSYTPSAVNVIAGKESSGKTSFLDAIAYADSTDQEFHSMLKLSHGKASEKASLDTLVNFNFFKNQSDLEYCETRIQFGNRLFRLLQIRKTDYDVWVSAIGEHKQTSPTPDSKGGSVCRC